jgi:hypothetical protein
LAASGRGRDVPPPDDATKAKLRQQALGWLRAELDTWSNLLGSANGPQPGSIARTLEYWQTEPDLAGIRDPDALAKVPADERDSFTELWTDVAALRKQAEASKAE